MLGSLPSGLTFTRASTATYFDVTGTMQTAATNTPRFDYNPSTHALNGLLIEETRTNLLLNSATLSTQSVTVTAQAYTLSFYGTGTITKSGTASGALVGTGAFPARVTQTFTPTAGSLTLTVTGTVQNAQLEAGAFPTSYIPTTGASATRSAEACNGTIGAWYSSTASSFVLEGLITHAWVAANSYWLIADDTTASNRIAMLSAATNPQNIATTLGAGGTTYANVTGQLTTTPPAIFKYAIAVGGGQLLVYGNSNQTLSIASGTPTGVSRFSLGTLGTVPISSYLRRVRYWPRVLTAAELAQVTT